MTAPLNIRDIGADRKKALEAEAKRAGVSIAEVVRSWIDAGIAQSESDRAKANWIASAKAGVEAEAKRLEKQGASLARFRKV